MPVTVDRLRYRTLMQVCSNRALFAAYARTGGRAELRARPGMEIVIEGFPRSANSFMVRAFKAAQRRRTLVAHHLHAAAHVELAVRLQLPTLIVIRHPEQAVASLLVRDPRVPVDLALADYSGFHRTVDRLRDQLVLADFGTVIRDVPAVTAAVNARFGTTFASWVNEPARDRGVFALIESHNERYQSGRAQMLARPTADKEAALDGARLVVRRQARLGEAVSWYERLRRHAV